MEEIQPGIYRSGDKLFTRNADSGARVYGEALVDESGEEYRKWNPDRSKVASAVMNGIELDINRNHKILYLGAASGTTVSHISDILREGFVYAVEYSETTARDLLKLAEKRENIAPILANARKPEEYSDIVSEVDVVFQDISQQDQAEIFLRNCRKYLKDCGVGLISVKAKSISTSRDPDEIFEETKERLRKEMEIVEEALLQPYESDHLFLKLKKKE